MQMRSLMAVVASVLAAACASTGATFRSGVAPKSFENAPYYAGAQVAPSGNRIAHLRIRYQFGAEQPAIFEPKADSASPAAQLVAEMNRYLDSLGATVGIARIGRNPCAIGKAEYKTTFLELVIAHSEASAVAWI